MDQKGKPRILLVDDEVQLLGLMRDYLVRKGYEADISPDAKGAFAAVANAVASYDLLVADVTLPDMSGQDMALEMMRADPSLRVLLASGYPIVIELLPEAVHKRVAALDKPFLPSALAQAIDELLRREIV